MGFLFEDCCIKDTNEYIPLQTLESLFAHYIQTRKKDFCKNECIVVVNLYIESLVLNENNLILTPGWTYLEEKLSTRVVVGLKVVRPSGV
jgi:hypothetical protein